MTAEEFCRLAAQMFGAKHGWQRACAEALGIHPTQVSRYAKGANAIPGPVAIAIRLMSRSREEGPNG